MFTCEARNSVALAGALCQVLDRLHHALAAAAALRQSFDGLLQGAAAAAACTREQRSYMLVHEGRGVKWHSTLMAIQHSKGADILVTAPVAVFTFAVVEPQASISALVGQAAGLSKLSVCACQILRVGTANLRCASNRNTLVLRRMVQNDALWRSAK